MFSSVVFLGYHISSEGIRPEEDKLKVLKEITYPTDVKGVRQFLGFCNFFQRFISNFSLYSSRLSSLLRKNSKWNGKEEISHSAIEGFDDIKENLSSVAQHQSFVDFNCFFLVLFLPFLVLQVFNSFYEKNKLDGKKNFGTQNYPKAMSITLKLVQNKLGNSILIILRRK